LKIEKRKRKEKRFKIRQLNVCFTQRRDVNSTLNGDQHIDRRRRKKCTQFHTIASHQHAIKKELKSWSIDFVVTPH
jgi:hypothetical protein